MKHPIKDFYGRIMGFIDDLPNGDQIAYDFYNVKLGTYYKKENVTKDFSNRILARGNILTGLIWDQEQKLKLKNRKATND